MILDDHLLTARTLAADDMVGSSCWALLLELHGARDART